VAKTATGRVETALGIFGVVAIGVATAIILKWNPWPQVQTWFAQIGPVSKPATAWAQRAAGQPNAAAITDRTVVIIMRGMVESHARNDGSLLWRKEADWAALAGGGPQQSVAIVANIKGKGFEAVDPAGGQARWTSPDAVGAWTFRDAVLALECGKTCALANRAPSDGTTRWRIPLAGSVKALAGANATLRDLREPDNEFTGKAESADPRPMPRFLGFPIDNRLQVIDTAAGRKLREEDIGKEARAVLAGNRIVRTSAVTRDNACRHTVQGMDAGTGQAVWQKEGYDLGTTSGGGCESRRDPPGGGVVIIATRGDNRQVCLSAVDGRELAAAAPGERIEATDGETALIRAADGKSVRALNLSRGGATAWTRQIVPKSKIGLTPYAVFVFDGTGERLTALDAATGAVKLNISTGSDLLGIHPDGVVLGRGRAIGFMGFGVVA
jgi:outer membrane protein assembly factor BamB